MDNTLDKGTIMKITKRQLRRIIKEEKQKLIREESKERKEGRLLADLDNIATAIEGIASEMYGMGEINWQSGLPDAGDELAKQLEAQVERLNTFHDLMVTYFEGPEFIDMTDPRAKGPEFIDMTDPKKLTR